MSPAIEKQLLRLFGATDSKELMNQLQDRGLVSDNAVSTHNVPDCDAKAAIVRIVGAGG